MKHEITPNSKKTHHFTGEMTQYLVINYAKEVIELFKEKLSEVKKVENNRYDVFIGRYKDKYITLICTGMTSGNTAMVIDEAIKQGAKYIFHTGTFGALQEGIETGDIYLVSGAVRSEGLTDAYAPMYYPATPDFGLAKAFADTALSKKVDFGSGIMHSVNIYSPYYKPTFNPDKYSYKTYKDLNVIGVEMECSSTYICSSVKCIKALSVLVCNRPWKIQRAYMEGKKVDWKLKDQEKIKTEAHKKVAECILETIDTL